MGHMRRMGHMGQMGRAALASGALLLCAMPAAAADELLTARAALADGLYPVAEQHLNRFLDRHRDRPADGVPALLWLCQALAAQERPADLLAALDARPEVVAAGRGEGGFDFWRARALLDAGRAREALDWVERSPLETLSDEYAAGLRRVAARARLELGDRDGARAIFATVDAGATNLAIKAENLLEWAQAELAAGEAEQSMALLRRQALLGATGAAATAVAAGQLLQARSLCLLGRTNDAGVVLLQLASNVTAGAAQRAEAWVEWAALAAAAGRTNEMLKAGRLALEQPLLPRQAARLARRFGELLLTLPTHVGEGAALLKRLVREQPGTPEAAAMQAALADAWLAAGSNEQAVAEYRIYLETYGEPERMATALRGKAWGLLRLRAYGEAAMAFQQAAAAFSNRAPRVECLLKAADALHAEGSRYEQAAALYEQVAREAQESSLAAAAAFMAADALERLGAADAAEKAFAALAAGGQGDQAIASLLRLAVLRERRNALEEAIADYGRAIASLATNDARRGFALLGRGRARYRGYQFEAASADFLLAQEGFPAVAAEAAHLRMLALYGAGRDDEAWQLAQAFARQYPSSPLLPDVHLWMAKFTYNRHAFAEAQRLFLDFVERWPDNIWADAALLWAGSAAFRRSEYTAAVEIMSRLPRAYPASPRLAEARFVQAEALCELARFEDAILVLDEIVNRYPESEWVTPAWMRKGDSLFSLGSGAPGHYEQAMQAYAVVEARPDVTIEQALQAAYKSGRCLEKLERADEALERYYDRVMVRFLKERSEGVWHSTAAQTWFASAGLQAADLLEARRDYEAAVRVLQRVEEADVPGKVEARTRLQRIQAEYRWHWQPLRRPAGGEGEP